MNDKPAPAAIPSESGWETYWRFRGTHRLHVAPVAGCRWCEADASAPRSLVALVCSAS